MKFSSKCRAKKLGMIYTILGSFSSFFNWEGAVIDSLKSVKGKSLIGEMQCYYSMLFLCFQTHGQKTGSYCLEALFQFGLLHLHTFSRLLMLGQSLWKTENHILYRNL